MSLVLSYLSKAIDSLAGKKAIGNAVTGEGWTNIVGGPDVNSLSGVGTTDFNALMSQFKGNVFDVTTLVAQKAPTIPLKLYAVQPDGSKDLITDHRFLNMWKNVNPSQNHFDMMELTIIYLCMTGNNYLWLNKDGLGLPSEMWTLPAHRVKIIPGKTGEDIILGYELYKNRGQKVFFPADEIIHFKLPNPYDPFFYGLSLVWAAAISIDLKNDINRTERAMMRNVGRPDLGIMMKGDADPSSDNFKRFKKDFIREYSGTGDAGKPLFLAGVEDIKNWNFPIRDFSFLKGRSSTKEDVYSTWKVPITYGSRENAPARATTDSDKVRLIEDAVAPHLIRIQEKLNEQLLPLYDERLVCEFDITSALPADQKFMLEERASNIRSGFTTVDEEREKIGRDPRPDGAGGTVFVPINSIPASEAGGVEGKALESAMQELPSHNAITAIKGKAKEKVHNISPAQVEKIVAPQIGTMRREIKKVYKKLGKDAADILGKLE